MTRKRVRADRYNGSVLHGIDVSHWQRNVDFGRVRASGVAFVYCRAADGKDQDKTFLPRYEAARKAGLKRGAYIYIRADRDGATQADALLSLLDRAGTDLEDLVPAVDLERKSGKNLPGGIYEGSSEKLPSRLVLEETLECLEKIENALGVPPVLYTGEFFHWIASQGAPDVAEDFARYPLWVPSYADGPPRVPSRGGRPFPWKEWTIHQYTGKGTVDGVDGPVDRNLFRGSDLSRLTIGYGGDRPEDRKRACCCKCCKH